jgi:Flp pilus assembly protein TadD
MKRSCVFPVALTAAALVVIASTSPALGAGTDLPRSESKRSPTAAELFENGKRAIDAEQFAEAERLFADALRQSSKSPDILNMLAYSQRKQGKLDKAFANYEKALKLRARFPEAREYLGEAHIDAAVREIETLKGYGPEAKQQLDDLIEALKKAAAAY